MKLRAPLVLFLAMGSLIAAQTAIDKPAATLKLTKSEVVSARQFRADVERIESAIGTKLDAPARRQILENRVNGMLFVQFCEREKILAPEAEINQSMAQLKASLGAGADDAKLEAALRAQGVFLDPRTYVRQQILLRNYIQTKRAEDLKAVKEPSAEEILKAYELYKSQLVRPDTVRVSVIFADFRGMDAEQKRKSTEALRQAASQLKANPSRFDELMLKTNEAGSPLKASPSVYVERTPRFVELYGNRFLDVAFALEPGKVSEVIENEAGIQVLRVNEVLPQKQLGLSDPVPGQANATVQDYIKYNLAMERQNAVLQKIQEELIAKLRKEGSVKIFEENLSF